MVRETFFTIREVTFLHGKTDLNFCPFVPCKKSEPLQTNLNTKSNGKN